MSIALKSARKTRYWLVLIKRSNVVSISMDNYIREIEEIVNILTAIVKSANENEER